MGIYIIIDITIQIYKKTISCSEVNLYQSIAYYFLDHQYIGSDWRFCKNKVDLYNRNHLKILYN